VVADVQHARLSQISARRAGGGSIEVKAPMPGMVVAVKVKVGDVVKKGQSLLALHAMKLENDIRSPRDGVVEVVSVKSGDVLEKGMPMMKLGAPRA
jgi:pyruvate carboxylase subunit B